MPASYRSAMQRDEVLHVLRDKAVEMFDVEGEQLQEGTSFVDDLGIDSLLLVEYTMDVEDELGVELAEQDTVDVTTIGGFADVVVAKLAAKQ